MGSCLSRRRESLGWRIFAHLLAVPILVLYTLALTGSVTDSPGISNVFSFRIQSSSVPPSNNAPLEIRVGFFGTCSVQPSFINCHSTATQTVAEISNSFSVPGSDQKVDAALSKLLPTALDLQSKIAFPLLSFAGASFFIGYCLMLIFKLRLKRKSPGPGPGQSMKAFMFTLILLSIASVFASVFASTLTLSALQYVAGLDRDPAILISGGNALLGLQWAILALSMLFAMGVNMLFTGRGSQFGGSNINNGYGRPPAFTGGFLAPPPPPPPPPPMM